MKKASEYDLFLAGINEAYGANRYVAKNQHNHYYVDNPVAGPNSDFVNNFGTIGQWAADGALVTSWCVEKLKRMVAGYRDAQNQISEDTEADLLHYLGQIQVKFKELGDLMENASESWEKMVDDHDL